MPSADAPMRRAETICLRAGEQFTPLRRSILAQLIALNRPVGAYDLAPVCSDRLARQIYPSSVYRVLQFWCGLGVVTHLSGHNTFVLTSALPREVTHLVFVCARCGSATQRGDEATSAALRSAARSLNFSPSGRPIEIDGTCVRCKG
jgi:Fur family zinc uptake transcriptional regulator